MSVLQKRSLTEIICAVLLAFVFVLRSVGFAEEGTIRTKLGKCPNNFPNLINDISWKCLLPLRIGGKKVLSVAEIPDCVNTQNVDDFNPSEYTCSCQADDRTYMGIWVSFWEPARVIELTPKPGCLSFLFGTNLGDRAGLSGTPGSPGNFVQDAGDYAFYNVHVYAFPLLTVMDLIKDMDFCSDWFTDIDIIYFSEFDPMWNDDELTMWANPEAFVFANPIAQTACAADCVAASAGFPINAMFWCLGCWGSTYPMSGLTELTQSRVSHTSLIAARMLAKLTRFPVPPAMELDTSGPVAKCGKLAQMIRPLIKKSQYKFSMLSPVPETKGCHTLGASSLLWGEWKNIPGKEEFIYLVWRKRNCCLRILP